MGPEDVVWITGASSGIGAALAKAWAAHGDVKLILSGRRVEALENTVRACAPAECLILPFDVTDYEASPDVVERAKAWRGRIDVLVNNAGIGQGSLAHETNFEVYKRIMEVNFFAPLRLTQLVLPHMRTRQEGRVVQIASVAGKLGVPSRSAYCASKHALIGYSDALRAECEKEGVFVQVITPGYIRTDITVHALRGDGSPAARVVPAATDKRMDCDDAARLMLEGVLANKREIFVGGQTERLGLWVKRLWPNKLFDMIATRG